MGPHQGLVMVMVIMMVVRRTQARVVLGRDGGYRGIVVNIEDDIKEEHCPVILASIKVRRQGNVVIVHILWLWRNDTDKPCDGILVDYLQSRNNWLLRTEELAQSPHFCTVQAHGPGAVDVRGFEVDCMCRSRSVHTRHQPTLLLIVGRKGGRIDCWSRSRSCRGSIRSDRC